MTYDDNGKVIPLSERFNSRKADARFSKRECANRNLVGVHNISEEKMLNVLKLGGLANRQWR